MDGWSARAVPGAEQFLVSVCFSGLFFDAVNPRPEGREGRLLPPSFPIGVLLVNFLPIERLREGGARQSKTLNSFCAVYADGQRHCLRRVRRRLATFDFHREISTMIFLLFQTSSSLLFFAAKQHPDPIKQQAV